MKKFVTFILLEFALLNPARGCGGIGGGGIITNPSFQMHFYPPAAWTYPDANAETFISYFPQQPLTQTEAQLRANGDLNSAVLAGLQALQLPTTGVTVTPSYSPPMINDCQKSTTPAGNVPIGGSFGIEEGGAITKVITVTVAITGALCSARNFAGTTPPTYAPFDKQASVKVDGITVSEYQANLLAAKISQYLMLNSKVAFVEEVTAN